MWNTEAEFVKYFTGRLRDCGFFVQRLESHSTGNGIPDVYVAGYGTDTFIEFKLNKRMCLSDKSVTPAWRPGQQAWSLRYHNATRGNTFTIIGGNSCICVIKMLDHCLYDKTFDMNSKYVKLIPLKYLTNTVLINLVVRNIIDI